jgi:hypothetical protein
MNYTSRAFKEELCAQNLENTASIAQYHVPYKDSFLQLDLRNKNYINYMSEKKLGYF